MPKIVDLEQRKAQFVQASWDIIAREGLSAATLRRVAEQAGCTTGALTHYFADRDALLIDTLRGAHYAAGARMLAAARAATNDLQRLRAVLLEALPLDEVRLKEWKVWLSFWGAVAGNAVLAGENARRYTEWRELLEDCVAPLLADPARVAGEVTVLMALVDGFGVQLALLSSDARTLRGQQRRCQKELEAYLRRFTGDM